MPKKANWNTGLHYSKDKQPIKAVYLDGYIYFNDFARHIDGRFPMRLYPEHKHEIIRAVHTCYVEGWYYQHIPLDSPFYRNRGEGELGAWLYDPSDIVTG